jgi:hypothetical protein
MHMYASDISCYKQSIHVPRPVWPLILSLCLLWQLTRPSAQFCTFMKDALSNLMVTALNFTTVRFYLKAST